MANLPSAVRDVEVFDKTLWAAQDSGIVAAFDLRNTSQIMEKCVVGAENLNSALKMTYEASKDQLWIGCSDRIMLV